jgi:site-specific recombinase XerD
MTTSGVVPWVAGRRGQPIYAVRSEHIEDYLAMLAAGGLAEASRAVALAAISAYYRRAVHEGAMAANPCAFVQRPKPAAQQQNQARSISRAQASIFADRGAGALGAALGLRDPAALLGGQRAVLAGLIALHARLDHLIAPAPEEGL